MNRHLKTKHIRKIDAQQTEATRLAGAGVSKDGSRIHIGHNTRRMRMKRSIRNGVRNVFVLDPLKRRLLHEGDTVSNAEATALVADEMLRRANLAAGIISKKEYKRDHGRSTISSIAATGSAHDPEVQALLQEKSDRLDTDLDLTTQKGQKEKLERWDMRLRVIDEAKLREKSVGLNQDLNDIGYLATGHEVGKAEKEGFENRLATLTNETIPALRNPGTEEPTNAWLDPYVHNYKTAGHERAIDLRARLVRISQAVASPRINHNTKEWQELYQEEQRIKTDLAQLDPMTQRYLRLDPARRRAVDRARTELTEAEDSRRRLQIILKEPGVQPTPAEITEYAIEYDKKAREQLKITSQIAALQAVTARKGDHEAGTLPDKKLAEESLRIGNRIAEIQTTLGNPVYVESFGRVNSAQNAIKNYQQKNDELESKKQQHSLSDDPNERKNLAAEITKILNQELPGLRQLAQNAQGLVEVNDDTRAAEAKRQFANRATYEAHFAQPTQQRWAEALAADPNLTPAIFARHEARLQSLLDNAYRTVGKGVNENRQKELLAEQRELGGELRMLSTRLHEWSVQDSASAPYSLRKPHGTDLNVRPLVKEERRGVVKAMSAIGTPARKGRTTTKLTRKADKQAIKAANLRSEAADARALARQAGEDENALLANLTPAQLVEYHQAHRSRGRRPPPPKVPTVRVPRYPKGNILTVQPPRSAARHRPPRLTLAERAGNVVSKGQQFLAQELQADQQVIRGTAEFIRGELATDKRLAQQVGRAARSAGRRVIDSGAGQFVRDQYYRRTAGSRSRRRGNGNTPPPPEA